MKGFVKKGAVILAAGMLLTGCGEEMVTLTESEEAVIVNYSAGTLAKFNKSQQDGLTAVAPKEEEEVTETEETKNEEQEKQEGQSENQKPIQPEETQPEETQPEVNLAQAIGITGIEVQYTGYEMRSSYEESDYFSMEAAGGNTYFVMKFTLTNTGNEEIMCDILNQKPVFTLSLNGNTARKNEVTMLPNDLATYTESLAPGASVETVLIFEVPVEETTEINSVQMGIQINGNNKNVTL